MITRIKAEREKRGIQQKDLAAELSLAPSTLANYEKGEREPPLDVLCAIADKFDLSLDMLIRGKEKDHPEEWSKDQVLKRLGSYDLETLQTIMILSSYLSSHKAKEESPGQGSTDTQ